jgi:hypothetical protein
VLMFPQFVFLLSTRFAFADMPIEASENYRYVSVWVLTASFGRSRARYIALAANQ